MIRSMYSGIGGLRNFQTKLDIIGNNIANVNTFGYKKGRVTFQDIMSQQLQGASTPTDTRGGTNPMQVGLGGGLASIDAIHTQGSMQTTGRALDIGISGDGFFVVGDGNLNSYSRAGNFYLDTNGTLVNGEGLRVMGYRTNAAGEMDYTQLQSLQIQAGSQMAPEATTNVSFKGNLNADFAVRGSALAGSDITRDALAAQLKTGDVTNGSVVKFQVSDSLGGIHDIELVFQRASTPTGTPPTDTWEVFQITPGATAGNVDVSAAISTLTFNSEGNLESSTAGTITITPTNGAAATPITLNADSFSNIKRFSGSSTIDVNEVNGSLDGFLESFNIGPSGEIVGVYSNGKIQTLGQIALATFNNPGGLTKVGNNTYQPSNNSGQPNIGAPGEGRGTLMGAALEMSNVDLSEEFTEMIVAQRGFQANTRIITTSDEILQELVNLKR